ncbi:hypothetical protein NDU88_008637 [Pleurodeles waltl]|uniref:Peptidase A2 domain-containing protein n=1 Tax=Pleurodeles waltl TaxID=8319 RepID=A0AAV7QP56_PLEWA|nr:hypothetical protein NDU88_008637 [Pleurodeles waltl]
MFGPARSHGDTENVVEEQINECVLVVKDSANGNRVVVDPDIDVIIDGKNIKLLVDTGARITIVAQEKYMENWTSKTLYPPDVSTVAFEGSKIVLMGYFWASITIFDRTLRGKIYVAKKGINVLGLLHQAEFNLAIKPGRDKPVVLDDEGLSPVNVQIREVRKNAVRLADGSWWNNSRIALDPVARDYSDVSITGSEFTPGINGEHKCRKSSRTCQTPKKFRDFVMS